MVARRSLVEGGGEGSSSSTDFAASGHDGLEKDETALVTAFGAGSFCPDSVVVALCPGVRTGSGFDDIEQFGIAQQLIAIIDA